jgi:hypothetical protein
MCRRGCRNFRMSLETDWQGYLDGNASREATIRQIIETAPRRKQRSKTKKYESPSQGMRSGRARTQWWSKMFWLSGLLHAGIFSEAQLESLGFSLNQFNSCLRTRGLSRHVSLLISALHDQSGSRRPAVGAGVLATVASLSVWNIP